MERGRKVLRGASCLPALNTEHYHAQAQDMDQDAPVPEGYMHPRKDVYQKATMLMQHSGDFRATIDSKTKVAVYGKLHRKDQVTGRKDVEENKPQQPPR